MNSFIIKIIAVITMFIDHVSYIIPNCSINLNYIGRISFPLFAFQISQGYLHTKNLKKYFIRLLILAVISQIPFMLLFQVQKLNIFFTLFLGLLCIFLYDNCSNRLFSIFSIIIICILSQFINVDYGAYGVFTIFLFYLFRNNKIVMCISFIILTLIKYIPAFIIANFYYPNIIMFLFNLIPLVFICMYNNKKGKDFKYFFYLFYPIHIIILYTIKLLFLI